MFSVGLKSGFDTKGVHGSLRVNGKTAFIHALGIASFEKMGKRKQVVAREIQAQVLQVQPLQHTW
jgi:hypothetical protein